MMKRSIYLTIAVVGLLLTSCGIYDKYESRMTVPADALGINADADPNATVPEVPSWREFFTDPLLQRLIDTALVRNTDLKSARIAIEQSQTALSMAKKAILPSLYFAPSGSLATFDGNSSKTYNVPLQVNWDPGQLGSYTNKRRAANAVLLQARANEQAVQANLVSAVAQQYSLLQLLDLQLDILEQTDSLWGASLNAQKVLWENGKIFSTAVNQQEASCLDVKTQIVDTRRNIRGVENALCNLLAITPRHIDRTPWGNFALPQVATQSLSARMLSRRPDVRMADFAMEEAFYNMQTARSAFYPGLSLAGSAGWTNNAGAAIVNPGKILLSLVGSLTQPIFARGQLKGNLRMAQLKQEDMRNRYVQTVISAGNQVNEALADCEAARDKHSYYSRQVEVLNEACKGTHELMDNGKANYLEVITAQETLLRAQLSRAMNLYDGAQAIIELYIALGGGGDTVQLKQ